MLVEHRLIVDLLTVPGVLMDEPRNAQEPPIVLPGANWPDGRWLLVLLILTAALRIWQVAHIEIASRDSIGFISQAWRFEHEPFGQVVRESQHHPGHPVCIWLVSKPIRALYPNDLPRAMERTAQIVGSFFSVLLVLPMFYLGKWIFDARVGFWSTLLFQLMPSTGKILSDGLSEPLLLVLGAMAIYAGARGLQGGRGGWFIVCGLMSGLAYLTRTEGLMIAFAVAVVLMGLQTQPRWRREWSLIRRHGLALVGSCVLIVVPFMWHIGGVSLKSAMKNLVEPGSGDNEKPADPDPVAHAVVMTWPMASYNYRVDGTQENASWWSARALVMRIDGVFFHVFTPFWLAGIWLYRRRGCDVPGIWILTVVCLVMLALLFRLGQSASYLSERHAILIAMGGVYFAVAAIGALAALLMRWSPMKMQSFVPALLMVLVVAVCLPKALRSTRAEQTPHRRAGEWLAQHAQPGDRVKDPQTWTAYYAGRTFIAGRPDIPRSKPAVCYVVLEQTPVPRPHLEFLLAPARELAKKGDVVYAEPIGKGAKSGELAISKVTLRQ